MGDVHETDDPDQITGTIVVPGIKVPDAGLRHGDGEPVGTHQNIVKVAIV